MDSVHYKSRGSRPISSVEFYLMHSKFEARPGFIPPRKYEEATRNLKTFHQYQVVGKKYRAMVYTKPGEPIWTKVAATKTQEQPSKLLVM